MRIVVLGYIIRAPLGGLAWHHFQYVLGLVNMGHEVLFMEDSDNFPGCYNPDSSTISSDPIYGLNFINKLFETYDLREKWAYFDAHTNRWYGQKEVDILDFCSKADLVLNISGVNPLRDWWCNIPKRIFIDTDPGFTQIRHLQEDNAMFVAKHHTDFFSFGENFGKTNCKIPDDGFTWKATRQPIYLPVWQAIIPSAHTKWTTVMQWDSYKEREHKGQRFGMKSLSFKDFLNLPQLMIDEHFELAIGGSTAPLEELKSRGWSIISSLTPTKTPWSYQQYIQSSKGEWAIAKHGYIISHSGWFSERSACYLASGRPVIVQDTGFSEFLPVGEGLLPFSSLEEAVDQVKRVAADYESHCRKARSVAEETFEATKVLGQLLNDVLG